MLDKSAFYCSGPIYRAPPYEADLSSTSCITLHKRGPANLIALLRLQRGHLRGTDLSKLSIRGANMQGLELQDASLLGALIRDTVFTESLDAVWAVAREAETAGSCLCGMCSAGSACEPLPGFAVLSML